MMYLMTWLMILSLRQIADISLPKRGSLPRVGEPLFCACKRL